MTSFLKESLEKKLNKSIKMIIKHHLYLIFVLLFKGSVYSLKDESNHSYEVESEFSGKKVL